MEKQDIKIDEIDKTSVPKTSVTRVVSIRLSTPGLMRTWTDREWTKSNTTAAYNLMQHRVRSKSPKNHSATATGSLPLVSSATALFIVDLQVGCTDKKSSIATNIHVPGRMKTFLTTPAVTCLTEPATLA
jgi:hypothetical protein